MAIDVLYDPALREGCLCSSTTGQAFGPILTNLDSREQLERFARAAERHLADGGSHTHLPELLEQWQHADDWPTSTQMLCLHCESAVDPADVKRAMNGGSWDLFDEHVRAACPECGQGDGDFMEINVCGHCGDRIDDVLLHVSCCSAMLTQRSSSVSHTKPPLGSVQTFAPGTRRKIG